MSQARLFTPFEFGGLDLANRIVISPMCQYSAEEGRMTDWHLIHLGQMALSGAALQVIEATAVAPEGRITSSDAGLWSDDCEAAMRRVLEGVRRWSDMPLGIQLAHAGRKASCELPWKGGRQIAPGAAPHGWRAVSACDTPFTPGDAAPRRLDVEGISQIRRAFAEAARRSARLGFDTVQIHGAHGYLIHQFLSPLCNDRDDAYGGSLENRMRVALEVFEAVRDAFPADRPVTFRVSATDWAEGGWDVEQTQALAQALEARGCAAIDVSSGGLTLKQTVPLGPGYQVPLARAVKQAVRMPVVAVGLITGFDQAEQILVAGDADLVALARGLLYDPRWPWRAAAHFGAQLKAAPQYLRAPPAGHAGLLVPFDDR